MNRKAIWIAAASLLAVALAVVLGVAFFKKGEPAPATGAPDPAAKAGGEEKHDITLPPGVEEPYCDCLADKIRPPDDWLPTRYSKSMWSTRQVPTEEEIKAYWEKAKKLHFNFTNDRPETSKEELMRALVTSNGYNKPDYYVTRFFRERVDINEPTGIQSSYYDYKTYYDRIRFEYLGPEYYRGPIPGSRVEETFMERYAIEKAAYETMLSPELRSKTGGRPLTEMPEVFDPETGLLWDQLSPVTQDASYFGFANADFSEVILLDYKLDEKGHLKEFVIRPIGRREAFRVIIDRPIESFIKNHFWAGWDSLEKNTIAMVPANKENEQYLQDLIRYRQPVTIELNNDFKRKTYVTGELISWRTHEEYIRLFDPADNKIVMEASVPKRGNPKHFVQVYYGGDFAFELSEHALGIPIAQTEMYPEIAEEKLKEDPEGMKKKIEDHLNAIWVYRDDHGAPTSASYTYSLRDRLTPLAPPFTGIKEYGGPIKFPYENDPNWKEDPVKFSRYMGFSFTGL